MKIVYIIEDFSIFGGVERIVSEKAGLFASEGHDVTIISVYKDDRPIRYPISKNVEIIFLDVSMVNKKNSRLLTILNRTTVFINAAIKLNKVIKRIDPRVIFFTTTLGALLLPICYTKAVKIYESHLPRFFNPYKTFFTIMERHADIIICLTQGDALEYRKAKKVKIIPNFINMPLSHVKDYSVKRAIAVGRLEEQKGFDILIDIWRDVAKKYPEWQLHIYGEGSWENILQKKIDSAGLNGKVLLQGSCVDIIEKYIDYSLHIMTSRYEGQGIVLIEAQACGLPSVVFDFDYGASDIIEDGVNGFLIQQGDKELFTKALIKIMNDVSLRIRQGNEASKKAKKFSKENIICKWEKLINELI